MEASELVSISFSLPLGRSWPQALCTAAMHSFKSRFDKDARRSFETLFSFKSFKALLYVHPFKTC